MIPDREGTEELGRVTGELAGSGIGAKPAEIDWPMKMFLRDDGRASVSTMQIDQIGSWKQQGNLISMTLEQVDGFGPTQLEAKLRGNQITVEYLEHDYSLQKVQAGDR
jgi:hypothetical protein